MKALLRQPLLLTGIVVAALAAPVACQRPAATSTAETKVAGNQLNAYWTELSEIPTTLPRREAPLPDNYRFLRLDLPGLRKHMALADASESRNQTIEMPLPNGNMETYVATPARTLTPELAAGYPLFRSYKGTAQANPSASIRLDLSDLGLKARINSGSDVILIDPYMPGDTLHYISYQRPERPNNRHKIKMPTGEPLPRPTREGRK